GKAARVEARPVDGPTVFTDASSQTWMAAAVWKTGEGWQKVTHRDPKASVQQLEAQAVAMACRLWPQKPTNVVTDSIFVFRLVRDMNLSGWANSDIANMLDLALQERSAPVFITHVQSHQKIEGGYYEGNSKADEAARGAWILQDAQQLHDHLHVGARALARACEIPLSQAREVIAACPYCQK
ncbi:POL1 protein, partial [Eudromia elegans]|nr:POL1 protein [Eudromia elegans]